jgi:predicted component of viral defense system (DUF524 family)
MANVPRRIEKISDFDPSELLATHEQHEKNITDLTERLAKIEGQISTPQAAAAFLQECAKDSRNFESVFATMFCRFLNENVEVKEAMQKRITETDRNFFFKTFKRLWLPIYSVILIVGTIVIKAMVEWLLKLLQHP